MAKSAKWTCCISVPRESILRIVYRLVKRFINSGPRLVDPLDPTVFSPSLERVPNNFCPIIRNLNLSCCARCNRKVYRCNRKPEKKDENLLLQICDAIFRRLAAFSAACSCANFLLSVKSYPNSRVTTEMIQPQTVAVANLWSFVVTRLHLGTRFACGPR